MAALAVTLFHFISGDGHFYAPPLLKAIAGKSWLGIEVFFVISGFVLPYSLWRAGYRLSLTNFRTFVWKRVVRLDPPYFVAIALAVFLSWIVTRVPGFHGPPFHLDFVQLALHFGYLNAFAGLPWLNPVFWTLAIECQFYLLIALIFPLFVSRSPGLRMGAAAVLLAPAWFFPNEALITAYLPLFVLGIGAFQRLAGICGRLEALAVSAAAIGILYSGLGGLAAMAGVAAAMTITAIPAWTNPPLAFLGTVSYSLYLLHVPIGGRVMNLAERLPQSDVRAVAAILVATAASIGAAWVLYYFVERPAQAYVSRLRFENHAGSRGH